MAQQVNFADEASFLALHDKDENAFMEAVFKQDYTHWAERLTPPSYRIYSAGCILKIWNNWQTLTLHYSIKSYLYRVAIAAALNYYRVAVRPPKTIRSRASFTAKGLV